MLAAFFTTFGNFLACFFLEDLTTLLASSVLLYKIGKYKGEI